MLSDTKIKSLKSKEKVYRVLDAERLYIEVRPTGKKIWRFKYTLNGKEGTISFGEYPIVSLAEARKKKDEARALLKDDINPVDEKRKRRQNLLRPHPILLLLTAFASSLSTVSQLISKTLLISPPTLLMLIHLYL